MISRNILHLLILSSLFFITTSCLQKETDYIDKVNPFIGTGGHGHTYPGTSAPFGMVQLSPDTRLKGWDGCSGYHYSDSIIYGFSHTHLSGTGVADYCDILFMPVARDVSIKSYNYKSKFSHNDEKAKPGYYSVFLPDNNVFIELTSSERAGFHKYSFESKNRPQVIIDLAHRDEVLESEFKIIDDYTLQGFRKSQSWAQEQYIYFVAKFSAPISSTSIYSNDSLINDITEINSKNIKSILSFDSLENNTLLIKIGISAVDYNGAQKNLEAEILHWDFSQTKRETQNDWNKNLGKIEIQGGTKEQQIVFYTALYHTMLVPNVFSDVDGRFRGTDLKIHKSNKHKTYSVFSLWDTYRATHPLYTILDKKRTLDFIKTFIDQYKFGGKLPMWELAGNYTGCMIGYHSVPVIVDAYLKGIDDFDVETVFEACKSTAFANELGKSEYEKYGFIPGNLEHESVSKTLEYAYNDWCIAQFAKKLDNRNDYKIFIQRAQYYKNLFDPQTNFIRAKINATWYMPFDPKEVNYNYTEANGWQYNFYVPHDIATFIKLNGGEKSFESKLDKLFSENIATTGRQQADITGLIGQYAHGNEPSHHMAYLYSFVGKPHKTQKIVNNILTEMYSNTPDGLIGNEDCGQMSAWYVFSAMGFYPVNPADGNYVFGTSIFDKVTIHLENGKKFVINSKRETPKDIHIQSVKLNGSDYKYSFIKHNDIAQGGSLEFTLTNNKESKFGNELQYCPKSKISDQQIVTVPYFATTKTIFVDCDTISIGHIDKKVKIYFSINNSSFEPYANPIIINQNTDIYTYAVDSLGNKSQTVQAKFTVLSKNISVFISKPYAYQYSAGGKLALIDGIRGGHDFRTGNWQGYEQNDLEIVVDFGSSKHAETVSIGFLQDINAWVFMPEFVEVYTSNNGKDFIFTGKIVNDISIESRGIIIKDFSLNMYPKNIRYIKIIAKNRGVCPKGHKGAGGKAWIFADEIIIK